jgi:hypothetical protein
MYVDLLQKGGGMKELYAVYIGHQSTGNGGGFDLFNIYDPEGLNELDGSTRGVDTVLKLKIKKVLTKDGIPVKLGVDTKGRVTTWKHSRWKKH